MKLTVPYKKHLHASTTLLTTLITRDSYSLSYEHTVLFLYRQALVLRNFWFPVYDLLCRLLKVSGDSITIFYLNVLNKTLKILYINGLSTIHRYILTATYSHSTQFYFVDYRCLYDLLQPSKIYTHKVLSCLRSVQGRQIYEWILSINY